MYLRVKLASQMSAITYLSHVHLFQGAQFYALSKLAKILMVPLMIGQEPQTRVLPSKGRRNFYIFSIYYG